MRNCKDCRFWGTKEPWGSNHRSCERIASSDNGPHGANNERVFIDAPGGCDGLLTAPEFGCVLFEAKDQAI